MSQPPSLPDDLEKVFDDIQQGKSLNAQGKHWDAAEKFLEARNLLRELAAAAKGHHQTTTTTDDDEEEIKIAKLYQEQCCEYFHRTRESLLQAMEQEHKKDMEQRVESLSASETETTSESQGEHYCYCQSLSDEEATKRIQLFSIMFAKDVTSLPTTTTSCTTNTTTKGETTAGESENKEDDVKHVLKKQLSLEERLMELNANLPKGLKTSKERLDDINQGMRRLGLSVYTDSGGPSGNNPLKIEPPKSASQQVDDIIAQAKDEVLMETTTPHHHNSSGHDRAASPVISDGGDTLSDDDVNYDDDDIDSLLSDEVPVLKNVTQIRDEMATAQAKLAELVALMDTIPSLEEKEDATLEIGQAKNKPSSSAFDPAFGKKTLMDARQSLNKALKLWKVKAR